MGENESPDYRRRYTGTIELQNAYASLVSMLDGDLFDKLEHIGRIMRKNPSPFGGIQIIVTGDFFQLPPVTKGSSSDVKFAFEAKQWGTVIQRTFNLTKVFRQTDQGWLKSYD